MSRKLHFICLFLILFIGQVNYVKGDTTIASGTISGTSIIWTLTSPNGVQENMKLSFTGSGAIPSFASGPSPWEFANPKITEVNVASTITEIGDYTFYKAAISSINIPSACTKIGMGAFEECSNLKEINIPSSCTSIGLQAFYGCKSLKEIYIPKSVVSIGERAFYGCKNLSFIYFEGRCTANTGIAISGVASTGFFFEKSGSGTSYAQVPSGWSYYTHDGSGTMAYVSNGTLYVRGKGAYKISSTYASWYSEKNSITKIVVEEGVTNIGGSAFEGCSNVTEVTLNNKGTIGYSAFGNCASLTRVNVGTGVTTLNSGSGTSYERPFYDCPKLSTINISDFKSFNAITGLHYLTDSSYGTAKEKTLMINGSTLSSSSVLIIPEGVTNITKSAIRYFKNVTKVKIPSTVTKVTYENFEDCKYLTEVTVPSSVTFLSHSTFKNCTALQTVTLNNQGVIHGSTFYGCTSLTRVNIGSGVTGFEEDPTSSDSYPFRYCSNLTTINVSDFKSFNAIKGLNYLTDSHYGTAKEKTLMINGSTLSSTSVLTIPEGVTNINIYAIRNFKNVTRVKIPSTVTKVTYENFEDCKYLTEVTVPSSVTFLSHSTFKNCTALQTVTLNNQGVIHGSTFYGCTSLTRVNIGSGVTGFEEDPTSSDSYPFRYCSNLTTINVSDFKSFNAITGLHYLTDSSYGTAKEKTLMINGSTLSSSSELIIPEGVTNINIYAIRYFKNLTKIRIPSTIGDIPYERFINCKYLTEVTLNNKGFVGWGAFSGCTSLTRVNVGTGVTALKSGSGTSSERPFYNCPNLSIINISDFKSFNAIAGLHYLTDSSYGTAKEKTLMINGSTLSSSSELIIPEGVTNINVYAIRNFKNVTKIRIPSTIGDIPYEHFINCKYLTEVTLNNKGFVGWGAFSGCTSLARVNVGTGVTALNSGSGSSSERPFYNCPNLSIINMSDFKSFNAITNLYYLTNSSYGTATEKTLMVNGTAHNADETFCIPEGVTSYNNSALRYFSNVKKVALPSTMTTVSGFSYHSYLTDVILSPSVTSVTSGAFSNCSALERIVCPATTPPTATGSIATNPSEITLKIPGGTRVVYNNADYWKEFIHEQIETQTVNLNLMAYQQWKLTPSSKASSWALSDDTYATLDGTMYGNGRYIQTKTFSYDGTTKQPYKTTDVTAVLDNGDLYVWKIKIYPRYVTLTDGDAYKNSEEFHPDRVTYTRTYAAKYAGNLQCFYVPFDVDVTDELLEGFTFYKLYMVSQKDLNGNGEIEEDEPLVMLLNKIPAGQVLTANMPYYIRPKAESTLTVTAYSTKLHAATPGTVSCSTTEKEYTLTGNNDRKNIKGYYTMSAKGNFSFYTQDTYLGSYRWYMSIRDRMGRNAENAGYARPIEILIEGEDDTTGIVALEDKVPASKNGKIYTLDGRQVTDFETLPSGIYIVNGKKVYKK